MFTGSGANNKFFCEKQNTKQSDYDKVSIILSFDLVRLGFPAEWFVTDDWFKDCEKVENTMIISVFTVSVCEKWFGGSEGNT